MLKLIQGILNFRERRYPAYAARFRDLAAGQAPLTFFVTCSDSRIVPSLLVSSDPGELFVMRNVGNLVPALGVDGDATGEVTGDVSEAAAVEYAVHFLKVRNIVVCGHSECGAMKAALARRPVPEAPHLTRWLCHAGGAVSRLEAEGPFDSRLSPHDQLSQVNVLVQLENLMSFPIVRERVDAGEMQLSGWWFDVASGDVFAHRPESGLFEVLDRRAAELLARTT